MSYEEELAELQSRYSGLQYESGFKAWWKKAWKVVREKGSAALRWLGRELQGIYERGGREIVLLAALVSLTALLFPAAAPVLAEAVISATLIGIVFRAFQT